MREERTWATSLCGDAAFRAGESDFFFRGVWRIVTELIVVAVVALPGLEDAAKLRDRLRVHIDAQVDLRMVEPVDDAQPRRALGPVHAVRALSAGVAPALD